MKYEEEEEEGEQAPKKEKKLSKKAQKRQKRTEKGDVRNHKDYELFLRDLEDDAEYRTNVNLYPDEDIMAELESKIQKMSINESSQLQ